MPLVLEHDEGNLILADDVFVVALDDTGHEKLHKANGECFGIGGCAFMVSDYQRLIEAPWNFMLQQFFPDVPRPVHAVEHFRNLTKEQMSTLTHFFTKFEFFRLAVTVSINTINSVDASYIEIVGASILQRIAEIAAHASFSRVFILFEASERFDKNVMQALSGKKLRSGDRYFSIELGVIPKSACVAALEVADVIAHTAGGQTRHRNRPDSPPVRKDFKDIFQTVDRRLVSFLEITAAVHKNT
jgi:hypothetical protein